MADPNWTQQLDDFASDATVDTTVDGFVNQGIEEISSRLPLGQSVEQMLTTEVDQTVNNEINTELNKGVDGILQDLGGLFGQR